MLKDVEDFFSENNFPLSFTVLFGLINIFSFVCIVYDTHQFQRCHIVFLFRMVTIVLIRYCNFTSKRGMSFGESERLGFYLFNRMCLGKLFLPEVCTKPEVNSYVIQKLCRNDFFVHTI